MAPRLLRAGPLVRLRVAAPAALRDNARPAESARRAAGESSGQPRVMTTTMTKTRPVSERRHLANAIRALAMDAVQQANSGHPGMPMGMADIAEVLWNDFLRHNPSNPS